MNLDHFFSGDWTFIKKISTPDLIIEGKAAFKIDDQGQKVFKEEGMSYECYQHYFYQIQENSFSILKFDHSVLHEFELKDHSFPMILQHTHLCGQDSYDCKFTIFDEKRFDIFYDIKGPKKNYTIITIYQKED